ncbi:MAG: hypothetical protein HDS56_00565 [Barnesiella sp.]|nr:hypothetical protein [Barnesiella sp.]
MKLTTFLIPAVSLLAGTATAPACVPYPPSIPSPLFFCIESIPTVNSYDRAENLREWQRLTSERIPLADIEQAVYKDSREMFMNYHHKELPTDNKFYCYLINSGDQDVIWMLDNAKILEERRAAASSPWYYPNQRNATPEGADYRDIIEGCRRSAASKSRLRDRYGLQVVRALFASRCYHDCVEYYDSVFAPMPDDNLMKRMAARYVAGCWSRMGNVERADTMFALGGDVLSLSMDDRVAFMAEINPAAPQLIDYVRYMASDSATMMSIVPVARRLAADPQVKNRGDWEYLLAYFSGRYADDPRVASRYVSSALSHNFSNPDLRDLARAYRMKLDAKRGDRSRLLADLKWIEDKCDLLNSDADEWVRILENIVYADLVPQLWKKRDYATAIMLCAYADYTGVTDRHIWVWDPGNGSKIVTAEEMRSDEKFFNKTDYRILSFRMMGSLTSGELIKTYSHMKSSTPLYNFLRRKMRTDSDFYHELIGTLALREENYSRAVTYFSKVRPAYFRTMNIYKGGYLARDPFAVYPGRWEVCGYSGWKWDSESSRERHPLPSADNAKINFARRMLAYSREMKSAPTADRRAMARLMYAIGRRNSMEECWALTQYWRGSYIGLFQPCFDVWGDKERFYERNYGFLYDYDDTVGHKYTEGVYDKEIREAMSMFVTDEARAEAEYVLGNVRTVIYRYGSTPAAARIRTSCDNWKDWVLARGN